MNIGKLFGFGEKDSQGDDLINIFPLSIEQAPFVKNDVISIYTKILTDVIERTQGMDDAIEATLWDNCLQSESSDGLITLLAKAMSEKADLFLVYDKPTKVLRKANGSEQQEIRADYAKQAKSDKGVFVSFKNYGRTDMVAIYSALDYCTVGSMNKTMRVAGVVQLKFKDLRRSVAAVDSADVKTSAQKIAKGMNEGRDIAIDGDDTVELAKPDLAPITTSFDVINQKRSFYLGGFPASYIAGALAKGLGDSGDADARAVERGLKPYFFSIIRPVLKALFNKEVSFKSEDYQQLSTSLEALKTFDITSNEHLSAENKTKIVNNLFGLPPDTEGDEPEKVETPPAADPNAKPDPAAAARDVTPPAKVPGKAP